LKAAELMSQVAAGCYLLQCCYRDWELTGIQSRLSVCMSGCLFVRAGKTAWAISTKVGSHYNPWWDLGMHRPEVKRSKVNVTGVSSAPGVCTHVDTTAYVF